MRGYETNEVKDSEQPFDHVSRRLHILCVWLARVQSSQRYVLLVHQYTRGKLWHTYMLTIYLVVK